MLVVPRRLAVLLYAAVGHFAISGRHSSRAGPHVRLVLDALISGGVPSRRHRALAFGVIRVVAHGDNRFGAGVKAAHIARQAHRALVANRGVARGDAL